MNCVTLIMKGVINMNRFIPEEKLSKRVKKELNKGKRNTWGSMNPITRKTQNQKIYSRKKVQRGSDDYTQVEPLIYSYGLRYY